MQSIFGSISISFITYIGKLSLEVFYFFIIGSNTEILYRTVLIANHEFVLSHVNV